MKKAVANAASERRLEQAAALLLEREVVPGPAPVPDFAALLAARGGRRRRWAAGLMLLVTGAVAGAAAVVVRQRAPISYVVAGEAVVGVDHVETRPTAGAAADQPARLRFSEGTEVTLLQPDTRLTVAARTARGAVLELERGEARFSVTHRRGARWSVVAGPFAVEVTGTEFTVDWSPDAGRMVVDLTVGTVRVAGASAGGAVELRAGERLVATTADHRLTLGPGGGGEGGEPETVPGFAAAGEAHPGADGVSSAAATPVRGPSRVVIDGPWGRPADRPALAVWSPRDGAADRMALPELPEPAVPVRDGAEPSHLAAAGARGGPRLDPAPVDSPPVAPPIPQSLTLGGGGLFCVTVPARYSFEDAASGLSAPRFYTLALTRPRIDRTHSWCGESSVRMDASFDAGGRRNFFGRYPDETGQLLVRLDRPTDLTGKTVTMHVFVEGPADARFSAEIAAVQRGAWASSAPVKDLAPGRWWTISHRFDVENPTGVVGSSNPFPYPTGGSSTVAETDRLSLAIQATGDRRAWKGAVYVDDISW